MKKQIKRYLSAIMVIALLIGVMSPTFSAENIVTHVVDIYANGVPVTERIVLEESKTLQLTPTLIDCSMPSGGYYYWESETPILASVDQNGLLRAHDSSKGAVLRLWLDNDVRTIPIVGPTVATAIEALFNGLDVDAMDAEGILAVIQAGASVLPGTLADSLIESLRVQLNSLDSGITVILYDAAGVELARDTVRVAVTKSTAITADFFPNGTTITNKSQCPSTVEVGYAIQLSAVTTPMRLHMGVTWSIKSGTAATLSSTGLATFTSPGDVVLMASPDVKGFMDNVLKYASLVGNDPETVAGTLASVLSTLGIPISTTIMKYVLWGLLYVVGTGNAVAWSEGAITTVANYLLKLSTNDTVTVHVVDNLPVTSFQIAGTTTVQEGSTQQLAVTNMVPKGATTQGINWQSANSDYIGIGATSGLMIGRDAGSNSGTRTSTVTATLDGLAISKGVTVTGKNSSAVTEVEITGPAAALIGSMTQMIAKTYPSRLIGAITWGMLADDGTTELFATATASAENSLARINKSGVVTPLEGGTVTIIAKTSETVKTYFKLFVGILVTGVSIQESPNVAVSVPLSQSYKNATATLHPVFSPADATNKTVIWSSSTGDISVDANGICTPTANSKCYATITAKTQDGGFKATCIVSFANYQVTGITLDKSSIDLYEGGTSKITETITPAGFLSMGAASIKDVIWTSSDTNVATVSGGTVTAVHPGNAVITATTIDAFKTAICNISVRANKTALNEMIAIVMAANLNPDNFPPEDFATFTQALEEALYIQGLELATQAQCDAAMRYLATNFNALNQFKPLQGLTLTFGGSPAPDFKTVKVGLLQNYSNQSLQFSYTLTPADADYKSITWSSSNSAMNIDSTGKCNPSANSATWSVITVRAEDFIGNVFTDSVGVAFANVPTTGISLNTTSISGGLVHNTYQLTATVTPTGTPLIGASITDVQWISGDPNVVTVSDSGLMTYVGPGSTTVTARTRDGGFSATCAVNVFLNKTLLQAALATVSNANLNAASYTPETWNAMLIALPIAQQAYDNPNAVQSEVDSATAQLNAAFTGLKTYIYVNSVSIYNGDTDAGGFVSKNVTLLQNYTNQSIDLTLRMSPLDAYFQSIVWSSNSSSVSVDQNGICRPTSNSLQGNLNPMAR
ncbi:MAG: Ig-like domain-containing protein, partial [Eubacteriales bacterium]